MKALDCLLLVVMFWLLQKQLHVLSQQKRCKHSQHHWDDGQRQH